MKALTSSLFSRQGMNWSRRATPTLVSAGLLVGVEAITNLIDYGFHVYLGRALSPGEFAVVQTMNAVLLILVTAFAVMQPVVARYVASAGATDAGPEMVPAITQAYFRQSGLLGLILLAVVWVLRGTVAEWLNVPTMAVTVAAPMVWLALVRPVVSGILQGREQFVGFGATRTAYAAGRFGLALLLIGLLGGGAIAGVAAMSVAGGLALLVGLSLLGRGIWRHDVTLPQGLVLEGWRLSLAALLAYTSFMALMNIDLIWVNRTFASETAGIYASAVVFRRIMAVLPGAVLIIFFPRVVARVSRGHLPDGLLLKTAAVIVGVGVLLTAVYFIIGTQLVQFMFGPQYLAPSLLLGWMGVAMIGFGATSIWLNLFLATRPWPFVAMLTGVALLELILLSSGPSTIQGVIAILVLSGWILALGGLGLYLFWMRPQLKDHGS